MLLYIVGSYKMGGVCLKLEFKGDYLAILNYFYIFQYYKWTLNLDSRENAL